MNVSKLTKEIMSWLLIILIAFIVVMLVHSQIMAKRVVAKSSMENTLYDGEQLLIDKLTYNFRDPKHGEIIIFFDGEERGNIIDDTIEIFESFKNGRKDAGLHRRLVKRVIALEGDTIDIKDGCVYLNGDLLSESYAKGQTLIYDTDVMDYPYVLKKNEMFVLGDNREVSLDSRDMGVINVNQVEGRILYRLYPFDSIGFIK